MTDKELQELADKVKMAIELEAPKARFIAFFFADESEDEKLRCISAAKCTTLDELGAIENLLNSLEDDGVNRAKLLGAMIASGSATVSRKDF